MKNTVNRLEQLEGVQIGKNDIIIVHIDHDVGLTDDEFCMATFGSQELMEATKRREDNESESDFLDRVSEAAKKMAVSRAQNIAAICLYRRIESFNNKHNFKVN